MITGVEVVAVVACVAAVISAYQDGSHVFHDIKRKWRERRSSHPQQSSATDLEYSLQRSRDDIVVQWNGHANRLGHRFEVGDEIAQATMKDILIGLQSAMLTHLRENGVNVNILALLNISDISRARTISAMHELYQRLAQEAPIPWLMTSPVAPGLPVIDPSSQLARYMDSLRTLSSSRVPVDSQSQYQYQSQYQQQQQQQYPQQHQLYRPAPVNYYSSPPVTPGRVYTGSISNSPPESTTFGRSTSSRRQSVEAISPRDKRQSSLSSFSSTFNWFRDRRRSSIEEMEEDDTSSCIADVANMPSLPPTSHAEACFMPSADSRNNSVSNKMHPAEAELDGPAEKDMLIENPWIEEQLEKEEQDNTYHRHQAEYQAQLQNQNQNYQGQAQGQGQWYTPTQQTTPNSTTGSSMNMYYMSPPTQKQPNARTSSIPRSAHSSISTESTTGSNSTASRHSLSTSSDIVSPLQNTRTGSSTSHSGRGHGQGPRTTLWPPSRSNDYAGFCKGAWKQNSGFEGFKVHNVPVGYYSLVPKWKCVSCFFDMPMASSSSGSSSSSSSPRFDEKVYTHSASKIRYRWSFLAKSHIASKSRPQPQGAAGTGSGSGGPVPKIGTFGCMFCCFESDCSVVAFGGLDTFLNHIGERHRGFAASLLGSTRCVVGRVAGVEEVFDVNIPPLE